MENGCMVEHHIKYKEIHGYDETVIMRHGEHIKLHNRLRKEGKCNISVAELIKPKKTNRNIIKTLLINRKNVEKNMI